MKSKTTKHLSLCLLVILLGICLLSISARAEKEAIGKPFADHRRGEN